MEPTAKKHVFKQGQSVIIMDKQDLIDKFGENEFGNPKTTVEFNQDGLMEHYYGAVATVTAVNSVFISVKIDEELPGKEYGWGVSEDMLVPNDGGYISTGGAAREPLRAFMPKTKTPTVKSVWRSLTALKKREDLPDGVIANLMIKYTSLDFDKFRTHMDHVVKFNPIGTVADSTIIAPYYPDMDVEDRALLCYLAKNKSTDTKEVKKEFLAMLKNKAFKAEFGLTPYTPYKRLRGATRDQHITRIWTHLTFNDSLVNKTSIGSERDLNNHIHTTVMRFMDKKKLHNLTHEKIEVK